MYVKFKMRFKIWNQCLIEEDMTKKEILISKRFAFGKFQQMIIDGKELIKRCNLRRKYILRIMFFTIFMSNNLKMHNMFINEQYITP